MEEKTGASAREPEGRSHGGLRLFVVLGVLLVLYPLSVGPMYKLRENGLAPSSATVLYAPLRMLCDRSEVAKGFIAWYLDDVWKVKR
jgi:hypothetical protein